MADFRWLLLAAGVLVLLLVFWVSRREARGQQFNPTGFLKKALPAAAPEAKGSPEVPGIDPGSTVQRIVTIRLMARAHGSFPAEGLVLALRQAGLRHGRFGIFHRHDKKDEGLIVFSVASLVEPGSFDLAQLKTARYPGVSLFLTLPAPIDAVTAFDDMLAIARTLAAQLDGEILDEQGSRLSVQRERYLREEVIQFQHKLVPP